MMGGGGMMGWGGGWAGSGGLGGSGGGVGLAGGGLLTLLLWVGIIAVGIVAVRWFWDKGRPAARGLPEESSLEILKRRYARGEIGRDEFETKKRDLV